jgi:hypothetical protein
MKKTQQEIIDTYPSSLKYLHNQLKLVDKELVRVLEEGVDQIRWAQMYIFFSGLIVASFVWGFYIFLFL